MKVEVVSRNRGTEAAVQHVSFTVREDGQGGAYVVMEP